VLGVHKTEENNILVRPNALTVRFDLRDDNRRVLLLGFCSVRDIFIWNKHLLVATWMTGELLWARGTDVFCAKFRPNSKKVKPNPFKSIKDGFLPPERRIAIVMLPALWPLN